MDEASFTLSAPKGPIEAKYSLFAMLGEPGWPGEYSEIWAMGDVGTAKTSAAMDSIIISALDYPESQNLVTRDFGTNLMSSTWKKFNERASELIESGVFEWYDKRSMYRCKKNGSTITFLGLDRASDRLFGEEWFRAVIDQGERVKEHSINLLHSRIRQQVKHRETGEIGKTWLKITANWDLGKKYVYRRIIQGGKLVAPDIYEKRITEVIGGREITANRLLIQSRIEENHSLTDDYFRHLLLAGELRHKVAGGTYVDAEGIVFPEYQDDWTIGRVEYLADSNIIVGLDYGQSHPTVAVFGAVRPNGECDVIADYVRNNSTVRDYAGDIKRKLTEFYRMNARGFYIYADPSIWNRNGGETIADQFMREFSNLPFEVNLIPAVKRKTGSISRGVDIIKGALTNHELRISDSAKNVRKMFQDTTWDDIKRDAVPVTDIFDATRYLAMNTGMAQPEIDIEEEDIEMLREKNGAARKEQPKPVPKVWGW